MALVLPLLIPLLAASASIAFWSYLRVQRALGLAAAVGLLAAGAWLLWLVRHEGIQVAQMGGWDAPFGITLVADHFSAVMVLVSGVIGLVTVVYSLVTIDDTRQSFAYFPLLHIMLGGVSAAFLTGDLFNLYVWFEVLLISSFVLLALGSERPQLEGALKYVALNLISSFLFLTAIGVLYALMGTLNMAHLAQELPRAVEEGRIDSGLITTVSLMFLVAFGIKAAIFPLFFWLPASYHTPPAAVSAVFAGLLTKVGVYALIRVFTLVFRDDVAFTHTLILVIAGFTMVTGVLGAYAQNEVRRILSFHIISQIGYMILGLGLFTPLALAGAVFYIVHNIFAKTNLFLVSGIVHKLSGSYQLDRLGGYYTAAPWLALGFAIPALSLAGMPPLSGFVAKLSLVRAGLERAQDETFLGPLWYYALVAAALGVGLITFLSMVKIWNGVFWKPAPDVPLGEPEETAAERHVGPMTASERWLTALPVAALAALTILMGVLAGPTFAVCEAAARELLDPQQYIDRVLVERTLGTDELP